MALTTALTQEFADFSNSFSRGYMKPHKAFGILSTLEDCPDIVSDNIRLLNFLDGCLKMEGFGDPEIEKILRWLISKSFAMS